ncbi:MAG: Cof-type HAD-IIB family hydrolase [Lachnospiraceae bacterium]|nr:Cof-type HAD-IIB family hydrolase [Lachnospiraceae bacterium]
MIDTKKRKLLVLDIDGTLVNSKKEITPKTLEALLEIQNMGHVVALASGRPYPGMEKYAKQIGLDRFGGYALSFNGGLIIKCDTKEEVYKNTIPNRFAKPIYDYAINNGLGMVTYEGDTVLTGTAVDEYMEYEARLNFLTLKRLDNFLEYVNFDMIKCLLTAPVETAREHELALADLLGEDLNVFRSEPYFIEITTKGVDKAKSLNVLLDILKIERENSICCGDGFNDLTMVQFGGVGVAMANAQQIIKDNADYITASCDEDGIVQVIDKFIK